MQNRNTTFLYAVIERNPMNVSEKYLSVFRASITDLMLSHNALIAKLAG